MFHVKMYMERLSFYERSIFDTVVLYIGLIAGITWVRLEKKLICIVFLTLHLSQPAFMAVQ
jgi:hypothetical protein